LYLGRLHSQSLFGQFELAM